MFKDPKEHVDDIFQIFQQGNHNPSIELYYVNAFTLLVAIVLSAQTTDKKVNIITKDLFIIVKSSVEMLKFGEINLSNKIKSIGLYNTKAKNIIALSDKLIKEKNSDIPNDFEYLITLPGVGRKSANVFLNTFFKCPRIAVDTHVFRVSNRIGFVNTSDVVKTEMELYNVINKKWLLYAHNWLVLHGRYICIARKPKCNICAINTFCRYYLQKSEVGNE